MSLYADVVRYPDLFLNIFRRELYGKYRGSVLGLFWTLVNPLALMAVYTLVFSVLLKAFQIEHYPLFVLSGLVTWVFFQSAVQMSCSSLFAQPTLVKQIAFPAPHSAAGRRGDQRRDARGHAASSSSSRT